MSKPLCVPFLFQDEKRYIFYSRLNSLFPKFCTRLSRQSLIDCLKKSCNACIEI